MNKEELSNSVSNKDQNPHSKISLDLRQARGAEALRKLRQEKEAAQAQQSVKQAEKIQRKSSQKRIKYDAYKGRGDSWKIYGFIDSDLK